MNNKRTKIKTPVPVKPHSYDSKVVKIKTDGNGFGALKTLIVVALIAVQVAIFVLLYIHFANIFRWYLTFSMLMTLITCVYVLSSPKNGLSKAVWVMFLLLSCGLGYIIYFLSDERIFFRGSKRKYKKIFKRAEKYKTEYKEPENASAAVVNDSKYLNNAGGFASYTDTAVKYFPSGAQLFDDVLERLKGAEKFVFIEFFIISQGVLLDRFLDIATEKAQKGVDIRIIYDDMGSHSVLPRKIKKKICAAGIKMHPFNRLLPQFSVGLNYRDHRKMIIIDGKTVYSGGSNFADEYINEKRMYGYWKDTGVRLDGRAVDGFTLMFLKQWEFLNGVEEDYAPYLGHSEKYENSSVVIPYADGLDYALPIGKNVYENIIAGAQEKLYIMTPYFIPGDTVTQLLVNKALSGVDVRIILPEVPDKAFVYIVSRNNAEKLMDAGVKIYCMKNSFVHSKLVLSENCAVIGSINFDLRSFFQQFECAVYTDDKQVMSDVEQDFIQTFTDSEQITDKTKRRNSRVYRIVAGVLQIFAPLM